jgi:hypothetical protein
MSDSIQADSGRGVERLVAGTPTSDGAGVRLTRVLTQDLQRRLDPFLMLDVFCTENADDYIGGFPDHPHRGFETVTYMIEGRMRHRDSAGNEGLLGPGGAQWMTTGSGLIHSEMPEQEDGRMEGFQLWLNLPAKNKMVAPSYRDIPPDAIPAFTTAEGLRVGVLAGESHGTAGAVQRPDTEPLFVDIHLPAGGRFVQPIAAGHHAFVFPFRGAVRVGGTRVPDRQMAILADDGGESVVLEADAETRVLVIAGRPLGEPIAQYGPFVMNTAAEIEQTLRDFRDGRLGMAAAKAL